MPVQFRSAAEVGKAGGAGVDLTITKPAGTVEGNVMVAAITTNGTITGIPSGWTQIYLDIFNTIRHGAWLKVAGASEPADYTWTTSDANRAGAIATLFDQNTSTPKDVDAHGHNQDTVAPGTIDAPTVTPTLGQAMILRIGHGHNINGGFISTGATIQQQGGNYTLRAEPVGNARSVLAFFTSDFQAGTDPTGTELITFNNSSGTQNQAASTIIIPPIPAGGGGIMGGDNPAILQPGRERIDRGQKILNPFGTKKRACMCPVGKCTCL